MYNIHLSSRGVSLFLNSGYTLILRVQALEPFTKLSVVGITISAAFMLVTAIAVEVAKTDTSFSAIY